MHTRLWWEKTWVRFYTQTQEGIYSEALISLLSESRLKNDVILWCQVEITNIIYYIIAAEVYSQKWKLWNSNNRNIRAKTTGILFVSSFYGDNLCRQILSNLQFFLKLLINYYLFVLWRSRFFNYNK